MTVAADGFVTQGGQCLPINELWVQEEEWRVGGKLADVRLGFRV